MINNVVECLVPETDGFGCSYLQGLFGCFCSYRMCRRSQAAYVLMLSSTFIFLISLGEEEDYDKWAIDILVKFRDTERLQLLTGHRQSGGVSLN